jgi:hypothetical protein
MPKVGGKVSVLASADVSRADAVVLSPTDVYWANLNEGRQMHVPKAGGQATLLVDFGSVDDAAIDATSFYMLSGGAVSSVPLTGGTPKTLASNFMGSSHMSIAGTTLYFTAPGPSSHNDFLMGTSNGRDVFWLSYGTQANGFVDGALFVSSPDCTGVVTLVSHLNHPLALALDGDELFFTTEQKATSQNGTLVDIPIRGGMATVLASSLRAPVAIAVDGHNAYVADAADLSGSGSGSIVSIPR